MTETIRLETAVLMIYRKDNVYHTTVLDRVVVETTPEGMTIKADSDQATDARAPEVEASVAQAVVHYANRVVELEKELHEANLKLNSMYYAANSILNGDTKPGLDVAGSRTF